MSYFDRLRVEDAKIKDLAAWEAVLVEKAKELVSANEIAELQSKNRKLTFELEAANIKSDLQNLLYRITMEYKDSLINQLKALYAAQLEYKDMMHAKAMILKDIDIATLKGKHELEQRIFLIEKKALQEHINIQEERHKMEKLGLEQRIVHLTQKYELLDAKQQVQLENLKKTYLSKLISGEMALMQSDIEKQYLLQRAGLSEAINSGMLKSMQQRNQLLVDLQSMKDKIEQMRNLKKEIGNVDSIKLLREYNTRSFAFSNQFQTHENAWSNMWKNKKNSSEWDAWESISTDSMNQLEENKERMNKVFHKITNLLNANTWEEKSLQYFNKDKWHYIDSKK